MLIGDHIAIRPQDTSKDAVYSRTSNGRRQRKDKNSLELVLCNAMTLGTTQLLCFLAFALFNMIIFRYVTNFDRLIPALAASPQFNSTTNFTDQIAQLKNLASNQSSDIKDIKKLLSQEVELLKSIGEGFSKTTTQASFATLGVFFMGTALVIYGLRLTLKAMDRRASRYLKAMILGLITPVIVLLA